MNLRQLLEFFDAQHAGNCTIPGTYEFIEQIAADIGIASQQYEANASHSIYEMSSSTRNEKSLNPLLNVDTWRPAQMTSLLRDYRNPSSCQSCL